MGLLVRIAAALSDRGIIQASLIDEPYYENHPSFVTLNEVK